jgi:ferrochelatase
MKYSGKKDYQHSSLEKTGLLITNLGTPEAPTAKALRKYLAEFLWDPRVVEIPRPIWWLVLNLIILRIRPRKSAAVYKKIWTEQGSPLMSHTLGQMEGIKQQLQARGLDHIEVECAMRYGQPSIEHALQKLQEKNVTKLCVLPLYPQYSGSTTGSTFDAVSQTLTQLRWVPEFRFIQQYAGHADYIKACADQIHQHWATHPRHEKLVFSFHGVPKRYLMSGDPYHCQCHKTARLIATQLRLSDEQWMTTFQSRFGREEWLQPYTDKTLEKLGQEGVQSIDVFCPGFSSDCVETLEEIDMENRAIFIEAGGKNFSYIPALNSTPSHIHALTNIAMMHMQGWPALDATYDDSQQEVELCKQRALAKGAKQ